MDIPAPVSETDITMPLDEPEISTVTRPSFGVCISAFSMRFVTIWRSLVSSNSMMGTVSVFVIERSIDRSRAR